MSGGLAAVIIILIIITGAVLTRRCTEFLLLGSLLGCVILYGRQALPSWAGILTAAVADNASLWLICGLFGSLIALLQSSKGTFGFSRLVSKLCTNERRTLLTSFVLGVLLFVDDYLNVLTIGVCMKGIFDERKQPREALAFLLNSTAAPVCVLLPVSTWAVFFGSLFYEEDIISSQYTSGMDAYLHAIPFSFYPIIALILVLLFCLGVLPKLGRMKKAYLRAAEGKVYSDESRKLNLRRDQSADGKGNIWFFLIPMLALVMIGVATTNILMAVIAALLICLILYLPARVMTLEDYFKDVISGFGDMLPIFFMLVAAFALKDVCTSLGLTEFLVALVQPILSPAIFPAAAFLLLGVLAFVTGSNWGMSAVVTPILLPMCAALGANPVLTMAAIISGGAFGSHACFYSDATILSASSAGISSMEHALSQLPYTAIAAGLTTVGYLIAGFLL